MKRKSILLVLLCLLSVRTALAQVNMQVFYDFGSDRKFVTMTLEMFKADKWGNTYFFIDHDFNYKQHDSNADNGVAPGCRRTPSSCSPTMPTCPKTSSRLS